MTYEERVIRQRDGDPRGPSGASMVRRSVIVRPSGGEMARRVVILLFGLLQVLVGARIVLLLLDAREANALVAWILQMSQLFVAPFDGIFRTDALTSGGSVLDIAAIAALVGWTVLEMIVLWTVALFRREPAA